MTSECSHKNIYWFYFFVEARFHQFVLAIFQASESHCLRFSYCICRAYVLMYWVGLVEGQLIVTHICAQRTVVFLSCLYLGWCMFMYLYNVLWCMPSPPYISANQTWYHVWMRHLDFSISSCFDILIPLFYLFIFYLCCMLDVLMSWHYT